MAKLKDQKASGGYTNPDPRLTYDFDTTAKLELKTRPTSDRIKVSCNIFRSWTGERRINGEIYTGRVFYFLSNDISRETSSDG